MKWIMIGLLAASAQAQLIDLSSLDRLDAKAKESSRVVLDGEKLALASGLISSGDAKTKSLLANIKSISIRSFEFKEKGAFASSDLDGIRKQLAQPGWSKIIDVKGDGETSEIYMFSQGTGNAGIAIIAAEPSELSVVNISGAVDLKTLADLKGKLPIPDISSSFGNSSNPPKPPRKD